MYRNTILLMLICSMVFVIAACGESTKSDEVTQTESSLETETSVETGTETETETKINAETDDEETRQEQANDRAVQYEYGTPVTVDNVIFIIKECTINPVKGDRTADNVGDENGEYFAIGDDIVKAADYEQIELSISIENTSDKAITFSEAGWEVKLPDGYKLEHITAEGKIGEQMPSNYKGEGKLIIVKEKAIKADKLQLKYNLMDYNEEWQEAIWKAISGELTEKQYKEKFNPTPVLFDIIIE